MQSLYFVIRTAPRNTGNGTDQIKNDIVASGKDDMWRVKMKRVTKGNKVSNTEESASRPDWTRPCGWNSDGGVAKRDFLMGPMIPL